MDRFVLRAGKLLLSKVKPVFFLGLDLMDGTAETGKAEDPLIRRQGKRETAVLLALGTHYLCICRH
ncbi:MAG: hypothetical protein OJF52_000280 [Nitrospira sp.]|jgi:hypothetical protein|nr:MAG: hypothetical protein OJF52_000280 [Nitrospira sp.]